MIAQQVAIAIENVNLYRELTYLTLTDPLTDMYNFRYFSKSLDFEIERIQWKMVGHSNVQHQFHCNAKIFIKSSKHYYCIFCIFIL